MECYIPTDDARNSDTTNNTAWKCKVDVQKGQWLIKYNVCVKNKVEEGQYKACTQ